MLPGAKRRTLWVAIFGVLLAVSVPVARQARASSNAKRPVTVADTINMTRIAGTSFPGVRPKSGFALFSPDHTLFAAVLSKGNTERNTNDYSIVLFHTKSVFRGVPGKTILTFSSSSNRAGIFNLRWLADNDTILFLGSRGNEPTQLYSIVCTSGKLTQLTHHSTSLVSYSYAERVGRYVYAAEPAEFSIMNRQVLRHGLTVGSENVADLIRGRLSSTDPEVFVMGKSSAETRLVTRGAVDRDFNTVFLSPDGRFAIVKTDVATAPEIWKGYQDPLVQGHFRVNLRILRYELIEIRSGRSEYLLDSPAPLSLSEVLWSPDSHSVLLCGTYLPLDVSDRQELQERESTKFVVELNLGSKQVVKITAESLSPIGWDARTNTVEFANLDHSQEDGSPEVRFFRKSGGVWSAVRSDPGLRSAEVPKIVTEQDLNTPPRIVAIDAKTGRKAVISDLNPQFAQLAFGEVQAMEWTDSAGNSLRGALYLPTDFKPGVRYPLVIQTHGFDPQAFWIEGAYTTADAAQPLASRGIAVLQMNDIFEDSLDTPFEAERAVAAYESAVKYLDQKGIVDSARVGLVGFSRTGFYVTSALTGSSLHIAAAVLSDGSTGGYVENVMFYTFLPRNSSEYDAILGGAPYGAALPLWMEKSPGFRLDKVDAPLEIQALGPTSLLGEWELFSGLKRLEKPVDLIYLPEGTHILVKPWDRLVSEEGTLDWFCFWLKGQEDPDPHKVLQYAHWRELRAEFERAKPGN